MTPTRTPLLQMIHDSLKWYAFSQITFERLVGRMGILIEELETVSLTDADRRQATEMRGEWGQLEIIWALALAEGRTALTPDEVQEVDGIVSSLQVLAGT